MDRKTIIKLATEAGWDAHHAGLDTRIQIFANLIAQHEREEWAKEFAGLGEWNCVHIIEDRNT